MPPTDETGGPPQNEENLEANKPLEKASRTSRDKAWSNRLEWLESVSAPILPEAEQEEQLIDSEEQIDADVPVDPNAQNAEKEILRSKQLKNDETAQRLRYQRLFFGFSAIVIAVPVAAGSFGFVWLVVRSSATDFTYSAFFASVVAEVVGLSYILGNYFFPNRNSKLTK
ncbi:hypothetical protein [Kocuria sp. cx-455]|uniref:hypothetical protein n=1 Tax=Kocuria sp. cx-455 TaxID=2771377 RepID=UPI003D7522D1